MSEISTAGDPAIRAETARLATLQSHGILDTPPEEAFDRITRLVRNIFGVSMSTVTLIDGHRQWFKSQQGMTTNETARGPALCNVAIRSATPLVVPDTLEDDRFRDNPFVTGAPYIRFYAGAPLAMPNGTIVGTLCAMDHVAQGFDARGVDILRDLAAIVVDEIARRPHAEAPLASATLPLSRRVLKAGQISFNGGRSVVDCTVRALAETGAHLAVVSTDGIPDAFKLAIPADRWSRACSVVAKRDCQIEVGFV